MNAVPSLIVVPSLPDLAVRLRDRALVLQERLSGAGSRLTTPQEKPEDFAAAQAALAELREVHLALAGIAALDPTCRVRVSTRARRPLSGRTDRVQPQSPALARKLSVS